MPGRGQRLFTLGKKKPSASQSRNMVCGQFKSIFFFFFPLTQTCCLSQGEAACSLGRRQNPAGLACSGSRWSRGRPGLAPAPAGPAAPDAVELPAFENCTGTGAYGARWGVCGQTIPPPSLPRGCASPVASCPERPHPLRDVAGARTIL